jgi:hypothetical protein
MICERCKCETNMSTGSYFNTQQICNTCDERERAHPDYERARAVELKEVKRGNYNFRGVGLPSDLA